MGSSVHGGVLLRRMERAPGNRAARRENNACKRYFDACDVTARPQWDWSYGKAGPPLCGFFGAGRAEVLASPAPQPHRLWGFPLSILFRFCWKSLTSLTWSSWWMRAFSAGRRWRRSPGADRRTGWIMAFCMKPGAGFVQSLRTLPGDAQPGLSPVHPAPAGLAPGLCPLHGPEGGVPRQALAGMA